MEAIRNKKGRIINLLIASLTGVLLVPQSGRTDTAFEQLIVFVQPDASPVEKTFHQRHLSPIRQLAETMGVSVHVVDPRKGSPAEIAITPLIVYQNHRGRSIYQGRTTTPERVRNFIRTSRFVPQGKEPNRRANIPIWRQGRTQIWAPLKIVEISGTPPTDYNYETFVDQALESIRQGFKKFQIQQEAELGRADRGFYMDFYPWRSKDGELYLSLALFSEFHCKEPVFTTKINGSWKNYRNLFKQAAAIMEDNVARIIRDPESGDSFDPVAKRTPPKSWEKIGFALPPAPEITIADPNIAVRLPKQWVLTKPDPEDPPMIQFRFPAPLDNYAGEVLAGKGEFSLGDDLKIDGAVGYIEIDTRTAITMGEPALDEAIRGSMMLYAKKFPTATFVAENVTGDGQPIAYGHLTPAAVNGTFTLKGTKIPLTATAEFEPIVGEEGNPLLLIRGAFKIDLRTFKIEGADGPAPARNTLLFDLNFILKEKG